MKKQIGPDSNRASTCQEPFYRLSPSSICNIILISQRRKLRGSERLNYLFNVTQLSDQASARNHTVIWYVNSNGKLVSNSWEVALTLISYLPKDLLGGGGEGREGSKPVSPRLSQNILLKGPGFK